MPKVANLSMEQAKRRVIDLIGAGSSVAEAMDYVDRHVKTYENWRATDPDFKKAIDAARVRRARALDAGQDPELYKLSFAEWRKRFLNRDTYPHQQMWIDLLEGRDPHVFHESITYNPGSKRNVLINTPPFHGKSQVITMEYTVYRLCMNPALRVMIVSKTAEMASKFLHSIKMMLTDPLFAELQAAYAPKEGWRPERGAGRWAGNMIYLAGRSSDAADPSAKDPSVQAVGVGGQIYGARCDLIILDDCVDDTNAHQFERQFDWLTRTVMSRAKDGFILAVGTRVAPRDLYSHLMDDDVYMSGKSPWTRLAQPAVLAYADEVKDWVTLWPKSSQPLDESGEHEADEAGLYPAWDGPALKVVMDRNRAGVWALVYQQQQVSDDMTFHPACVWGSVDKRRVPGPLIAGQIGHTPNGMEGMYVIGAIDPAGTGEAFVLVYAVDRITRKRWVLNAWTGNNTKPSWYAEKIEEVTPVYGVNEWVIEAQGYSNWIYHDERIMAYCRDHGIKLSSEYTGRNKIDPDFGVASMAPLFGAMRERTGGGPSDHDGLNVINLPDPRRSPGVKALVDQLMIWVPNKSGGKLRQDGPMALWIAEGRARIIVNGADKPVTTHVRNRFLSRRGMERRATFTPGY